MSEFTLTSYPLVTLNEVKVALNLSTTDEKRDDTLTMLINGVTGMIEAFCDRQFVARDYTAEYHDGDGCSDLYTDHFPINSVTSLYDDTARAWGADSLISSDSYVIYEQEGRIALIGSVSSFLYESFQLGNLNIKINYNAGYVTVPYDLKQIAFEIIMKKFKTFADHSVGINSRTQHGETITLNLNDILPEHRDILVRKYRRMDFGGN